MASITLQQVFKSYGNNPPVLRDVNLQIDDGEFCVFVGPSGCGKSTLLRMVAGLEDITSGQLDIGGRRMNDVAPAKRGVAMVFQSYALYPHLTVFENMAFGLTLAKVDKATIDKKVREVAAVLQLEQLLERKPKALSGGQRQRVAIGRAIVRQPEVFLFDEPLSNLDAALRVQTRIEIARLHKEFGQASMIYVTHDQVEAMTLADKIVLLNSGEAVARYGSVAQIGSPLELYHRPRNVFVAGFIGSPKMNLMSGRALTCAADGVLVELDNGERLMAAVDGARLAPGERVTLGIRPEHFQPGQDTQQVLQREVQWVEQLGEATYLYLRGEAEGAPVISRAIGHSRVRAGERVSFQAPASACHLFDSQGQALARHIDACLLQA